MNEGFPRECRARSRRAAAGLAVLLSAALTIAGCTSRDERAGVAAVEAQQLLQAGNPDGARAKAMESIAARDDLPHVWSLLGQIEISQGQIAAAFDAFQRANELDSNDQQALAAVAEISFLAGRYPDTERYADQMLALNPGNLRAQLLKGGVALRRRRFDDALAAADGVLRVDPTSQDARVLRAQAIAGQGDPAAAIAFLEEEMQRRGDADASVRELLRLRTTVGDLDGVLDAHKRLSALRPTDIEAQFDYARELLRRGRDAAALNVIDAVRLSRRDDAATVNRIVDMWLETGRDPVERATVMAIGEGGNMIERGAMARYSIERGRPADALALLAPIRGPDAISYANVEAQILVAMAEVSGGQVAAARARIDRVHAFDPTNPRGLALRARLLAEAGRLEPALNDAQVLIRDNPKLVEARLILADIYRRRGDPRLAERAYREGVTAVPDSGRMAEAFSTYLFTTGQPAAAARLSQNFVRDNPLDPRGWRLREATCVRVRDAACATEARERLRAIGSGSRGA